MKRKYFNFLIILIFFQFALSSCDDVWNNHYSQISSDKSPLSLYGYISQDTAVSVFAEMLKISGYNTVLDGTQTYSVWAPVNQLLSDVDLTDTAFVVEVVKNHISRFSTTTSDLNSKLVFMINKKYIPFLKQGSYFTFGGKTVLKSNIATANGILYHIDNYVPYTPNIWEFIGKTSQLDSLKAYLYSQDELTFDLSGSGSPIGYDSLTNQLIYDSVFVQTNPILSKLGQLGHEDSLYTVILPTNTAWIEAYDRIKPYFNTLKTDGGVAKQRENTQWALVQDIAFRQKVSNPALFDSITSTSGNVFYSPADYIFYGSTKTELSNGNVFVTDKMQHKANNSWQSVIKVEAEADYFGRTKSNADVYLRSSVGSGLSVSNEKYIYVNNLSKNDLQRSYVEFPIPNTLSAKYNIYCVFVPTSIVKSTDLRPSKAEFNLTYIDAAGKVISAKKITVSDNLTNPNDITKMFVTEFQFPYSNIVDFRTFKLSDITVKLRVNNAAKVYETVKYNRDMRIDCIILEPVQ